MRACQSPTSSSEASHYRAVERGHLWTVGKNSSHGVTVMPSVCSRRRLKRHPHKSPRKRIRGRRHSISTSAAVGSFEGRRHCSDHLLSIAMVFPLSSGVGKGGGGGGAGVGGEKSHNLKKDYINHLLCNPFTVPGLVKNCCKHRGHSFNNATFNYCFLFS